MSKKNPFDEFFSYKLEKTSSTTKARAGTLVTPHGKIETPVFMPVGTNSAVKTLVGEQVEATGEQIILSNSFHLFLRPGHKLIEKAGGLHKWMSRNKPILTDSGGFQVFSLADIRKIKEDGVEFSDPKSGAKHYIKKTLDRIINYAMINFYSFYLSIHFSKF